VGQCVVRVSHNDGIAYSLVADIAGSLKRRYDTPTQIIMVSNYQVACYSAR
jgi:hypothetical protein